MSVVDEATVLAKKQVKFEFQGRQILTSARVFQRMRPNPHVVIEISDFPWDYELFKDHSLPSAPVGISTAPVFSEGPSEVQFEDGAIVKVVPTSLIFGQRNIELHLNQSPCVALESGDMIQELQFDVLNFTGDVLDWSMNLYIEEWLLSIAPVSNLSKLKKELRDSAGYGVTHKASLGRKDNRLFKGKEIQSLLNSLHAFLSFLCGSQCGITNVSGFGSNGDLVWQRWGSHSVSGWRRQRSFMDITITDRISEIFTGFAGRYFEDCDYMGRIIALYITSNETRSADISIMLSQIALESLTTILKQEPPHKDEKVGNSIAKMLQERYINCDVPESFGALQSLAKSHELQHGPHALVEVRNSFVHRENKLGSVSIDAYYETKQLGLWYLELLLLNWFRYEGEYASRLEPVQKPGLTELVPWVKDS